MSSTEDIFQAALKNRQQERSNQNNYGFDSAFEQPEYTALEANEFKLLRFLGEPISVRKDPTSPSLIFHSFIAGDDGKNFRCVWPDKKAQPDWLLWKIYNKVMAYDWDKDSQVPRYHHSTSHPDLFNRVAKNNKIDNKYETGWRPTSYVLWNVIDRAEKVYNGFHKEQKKTLLLSKKGSPTQSGSMFYLPGVPVSLYNIILDEIVEINGDWNKYDIFVTKMQQDPWYKAYHAVDDFKKVSARLNDEATMRAMGYDPSVAERPLTEEELTWERYNIDKMFPLTSYRKIHNRLGVFIQSVDKAFGTHFYEELETLKEKEIAEQPEKEERTPSRSATPSPSPQPEASTDEAPAPEKAEARPRPRRTPPVEGQLKEPSFDEIAKENNFVGMDKLTEEMKAMITGYDDTKGTFTYRTDETVYSCVDENCTMESPESFTHCPKCGAEF